MKVKYLKIISLCVLILPFVLQLVIISKAGNDYDIDREVVYSPMYFGLFGLISLFIIGYVVFNHKLYHLKYPIKNDILLILVLNGSLLLLITLYYSAHLIFPFIK